MGSPFAPVVANFYMEHFKQQALIICATPLKLAHWLRYTDGSFLV
jgi:hypothetical protein